MADASRKIISTKDCSAGVRWGELLQLSTEQLHTNQSGACIRPLLARDFRGKKFYHEIAKSECDIRLKIRL